MTKSFTVPERDELMGLPSQASIASPSNIASTGQAQMASFN
jgi:hypothetical protein